MSTKPEANLKVRPAFALWLIDKFTSQVASSTNYDCASFVSSFLNLKIRYTVGRLHRSRLYEDDYVYDDDEIDEALTDLANSEPWGSCYHLIRKIQA